MAPPDPAASRLVEPASRESPITATPIPEVVAAAPAADETEDSSAPKAALQHTEFGVDLGGANSVAGLRALWRGFLKTRVYAPVFELRPIIVIKEGANSLGLQLRLVAGPLRDAGAAAKICAVLSENNRRCETTTFDGQRLTIKDEAPSAASPAVPAKPVQRRQSVPRRGAAPPPLADEAPKQPESTTFSFLFGRKGQ
jgi:hypothetical protein